MSSLLGVLFLVLAGTAVSSQDLGGRRNQLRLHKDGMYARNAARLRNDAAAAQQFPVLDGCARRSVTYHEAGSTAKKPLEASIEMCIEGAGGANPVLQIGGFIYWADATTGCVTTVVGAPVYTATERPPTFEGERMKEYLQAALTGVKAATHPNPGWGDDAILGLQNPWVNCRTVEKGRCESVTARRQPAARRSLVTLCFSVFLRPHHRPLSWRLKLRSHQCISTVV